MRTYLLLAAAALGFVACGGSPTALHDETAVRSWLVSSGTAAAADLMSYDFDRAMAIADSVYAALPSDRPRMREYGNVGWYALDSMLADAAAGGGFQCNDRATVLARAWTAMGFHARKGPLRDSTDVGHMLAEVWLPDAGMWVAVAPMERGPVMLDGLPIGLVQTFRRYKTGTDWHVSVNGNRAAYARIRPYLFNPMLAVDASVEPRPGVGAVYSYVESDRLVTVEGGKAFVWPVEVGRREE